MSGDSGEEERDTWSYKAGHKGLNRVRVFERYPDSPLWIEWKDEDDNRCRESLREVAGFPVRDRETARSIADRAARRLRKARRRTSALHELLGTTEPHTLKQLYDRLFEAKKGDAWGEKRRQAQERHRDFWYEKLGRDTLLRDVTPDAVESAARAAADERDWSAETRRKYLDSIVGAFNYAQQKLKWITEPENLSAVEKPRPDRHNERLRYEVSELFRLLKAAHEVDLRLGGIAEIAYATLRRKGAIRRLSADAYQQRELLDETLPVLVFEDQLEKTGRTSEAVLPDSTVEVIERLRAKPAVQATGLLFPRGDLENAEPPEAKRRPLASKTVNEWWRKAEKRAEVQHVQGRGLHGIKRTVTTLSQRLMGSLGPAAGQAATSEDTLRQVYLGDDPQPKRQLAQALERARQQGGKG